MPRFNVSSNACPFGVIDASNADEARDKAARMAGYESESDMEAQLGQPSEIVAEALGE